VFKIPVVAKIMSQLKQNVEGTSDRDAYEYINDNIEDYLSGLSSASRGSEQLILLMIGVANLLVFIQANWTGPSITNVEPIVRIAIHSTASSQCDLFVANARHSWPIIPLNIHCAS
jgi:hypothetical protein